MGYIVEFVIQARNDLCENRTSGRDKFEVKITQKVKVQNDEGEMVDKTIEIPCDIVDTDDGKYNCKYQAENEGKVDVNVYFEDDKGKMVPIRGSPYCASFIPGLKAIDNTMTGSIMDKYLKKEIDRLNNYMLDSKKEIMTKDKDLKDVKALLKVKDNVDSVINQTDNITL